MSNIWIMRQRIYTTLTATREDTSWMEGVQYNTHTFDLLYLVLFHEIKQMHAQLVLVRNQSSLLTKLYHILLSLVSIYFRPMSSHWLQTGRGHSRFLIVVRIFQRTARKYFSTTFVLWVLEINQHTTPTSNRQFQTKYGKWRSDTLNWIRRV